MVKNSRYTVEQLDFLKKSYASMAVRDIVPLFNAEFGLSRTRGQLKAALQNHGITCGRDYGQRLVSKRLFSTEQVQFIRNTYVDISAQELTDQFNSKFGTSFTRQQIFSFVHNNKINSGRTGRFEKGQSAWNKGVNGYIGPNVTSFKKGQRPKSWKPIGSERIDSKDGYILVKIAERDPHSGAPTRYKLKHVHVWETANGPVPKGFAVVFKDGNKLNCALSNLLLVSRAELLSMNLHRYSEAPEEVKPSILALAKLEAKAGIRTRPSSKGRRKKISEEAA